MTSTKKLRTRTGRFCYRLERLRSAVSGCGLTLVAYTGRPHRLALSETGIRVVDFGFETHDTEARLTEVWRAMLLLREHAPSQWRRIVKHVHIVILLPVKTDGRYIRVGRICLLNPNTMPTNWTPEARLIAMAGLLAHEATHGYLDARSIPFYGQLERRIEHLCEQEQNRAADRVLRAIQADTSQPKDPEYA